jgi:glyoxylase-like metal-dependent hydrolase (beta-lactamase superfamily II)
MKATHFSALSMCPRATFALGDVTEMVCHCLLVETKHGLVVVDCGLFAEADFEKNRTPNVFMTLMRPSRQTAKREIEKLGYSAKDVTHVVCTHLDLDHCGGIADFPDAAIHVMTAEREAAEHPPTMSEKRRYIRKHFSHGPKWKTHDAAGENWKGFSAVRALSDDEPDLLLVPLHGHSRGHAAVAVRTEADWLLHCGDAYFHEGEMNVSHAGAAKAPWGLEFFQRTIAIDDRMRRDNQRRLRALKKEHGDVHLFCAHSKAEFDHMRGAS